MRTPARELQEIGADRPRGVRGQAFDLIVRCFSETIGADTAALWAYRDPQIEVISSWAREGHELEPGSTSQTLVEQALAAHGPLLEPTPPVGGVAEVEAIAAPIHSADAVVGAIYAGFSPASSERAEELGWAAESYGRIAGLCMSKDLTMAEVFGSVGFDTLTGCLTYGGVLEVVRAEIQRSRRGGHRLSCCFLGLDGFERVNDAGGRLEANRVLAAVGQAMRQSARTYDAVGHLGGDEFVVVLPETGGVSGARTAARYRAAALRAIRETTAVPIDASVGIAEWDGDGSAIDLLGAADRALGQAKAAGGAVVAPASARTRLDRLLELARGVTRRRRGSA